MKIITFDEIRDLNISHKMSYNWIDYALRNRDKFIMPTKVRIPLTGSDYCNVMPCAMPEEKIFGLKVINRNTKRKEEGGLNLDSQILLYDYKTANLKAILDGNYITTIRTAAVAAHSAINFTNNFEVVAMLGLGNIAIAFGELFFPMVRNRITVKLLKYKDQAERFIDRFKNYNVVFQICYSYDELMEDSDLIISAVTYAENDFCQPSTYKAGCTIIPIHMRGFMECDREFDHIIVSDMIRAKGFKYYNDYKRVSITDDILAGNKKVRETPEERVLIYNLGLAITDLYFAHKIYALISTSGEREIKPKSNFYM